MRAHATQIAVDGPFFALSNDLGQPLFATEYYRWCAGPRAGGARGRPVRRGPGMSPARPRATRRPERPGARGWAPDGGSCRTSCSGCSPRWSARAGALVQSGWFPGGLLLALAAVAGAVLRRSEAHRHPVGGGVPRRCVAHHVLLLSSARPEGDFLFAAGIGPYIYLSAGALVGVICATLPQLPSSGVNDRPTWRLGPVSMEVLSGERSAGHGVASRAAQYGGARRRAA